jgi:hypothetical protein
MSREVTSNVAQYSPLIVSVNYKYSYNPLYEESSIGTVPYVIRNYVNEQVLQR